MEKNRFYKTYPILGIIILALCTFVPFALALAQSLLSYNGLEIGNVLLFFSNPGVLALLGLRTLGVLATSAICLIAGLFAARLLTIYDFSGSSFIKALLAFEAILPYSMSKLAMQTLIGKGGLCDRLFSVSVTNAEILIWVVLFLKFTALVTLVVNYSWERLDYTQEKAAVSLGNTRSVAFRTVVWPRLAPAATAAFSLVFLLSGPIVYGGSRYNSTIQNQALFSITYTVILLAALAVFCQAQRKALMNQCSDKSRYYAKREAQGFLPNLALIAFTLLSMVLVIAPKAALVLDSFLTKDLSFSIASYNRLFVGNKALILAAFTFGVLAISFALSRLGLALSVGINRKANGKTSSSFFALLGLCLSSMLFASGRRVFPKYEYMTPIVFFIMNLVAQQIPLTVLLSNSAIHFTDRNLVNAARSLGSTSAQSFRHIEKTAMRSAANASALLFMVIALADNRTSLLGNTSAGASVALVLGLAAFTVGHIIRRKGNE